jgi:EmrB/QacA subfamily drug resistance transporter
MEAADGVLVAVFQRDGGFSPRPHAPTRPMIVRTDRARSTGAALALLATAQLILALDYSIVNVALPDIGPSLGFTHGRVQWVISGYALTYGGFLLLGGRAADLLGRRRVWVGALVVFGLASIAGGLAVEPVLLVTSRALQGAAGAFLFPATLALVDSTFAEGPERTRAIAVWGSAGASGLALGVLAGGVLTGLFSWRAVFFVNVPIAIVLVAFAPIVLQTQPRPPARQRFDLPGAFLVTAGTMAIVFALVEGPTAGWLSVTTVGSAALGLALLGAFVVVETRSGSPLISLRLLRIRSLRGGLIVAAAWMSSFGMQLYFLTIFLQEVLHESPLRAGLSFLPLAISIVAGTRVGARLVGRIGIARTLAAGMALGAVGLFLYVRLPAEGSLADLIPGMIVAGLGQGIAFTTMYVAASTGVPEGSEGVASAMAMTAQQLGGSVGLALLVALLTERVTALGGTTVGSSIRPADVATSALHEDFAAQGIIAILGAATALFVVGRGWRGRPRVAERDARDGDGMNTKDA